MIKEIVFLAKPLHAWENILALLHPAPKVMGQPNIYPWAIHGLSPTTEGV